MRLATEPYILAIVKDAVQAARLRLTEDARQAVKEVVRSWTEDARQAVKEVVRSWTIRPIQPRS